MLLLGGASTVLLGTWRRGADVAWGSVHIPTLKAIGIGLP